MFVAAGQFVVSSVWEKNAQVCVSLMAQAAGRGVSLLVLPEGILARDDIDLDLPIRAAQLHLYDAFSMQESQSIDAGTVIAPVLDVEGVKVGLMTCYDLRFPDMALALALQGADVLALPTGWVRGPLKEQQWSTLLAARALDTTCYMIAAGECGNRNIGQSRIIDPLGVTIAAAADRPALIVAEIFRERIDQVREQLPLLQQRRFAPPQLL